MNRLYSLDEDDFTQIMKWDILCLQETWLMTPPTHIPHISDYFNVIFSAAVKEKQKGRGSGGLLTLIKKEIPYEVTNICNLWIFVKIQIPDSQFILGNVYISPKFNYIQAMESMQNLLESITDFKVVVGGDYNGRIGELNYLDIPDLTDSGFEAERSSMDTVINTRGEQLVEVMEICGFFALNGRTFGDIPSQYTYLCSAGNSVIDFVWCNWEMAEKVNSLCVSGSLLESDHLPVVTEINIPTMICEEEQVNSEFSGDNSTLHYRCTWSEELKDTFSTELENILQGQIENQSFYCNIKDGILETSQKLKLWKPLRKTKKINFKKKWYNWNCQKIKTEYRSLFKKWKRSNNNEILITFLQRKKDYFTMCKNEKNGHEKEVQEKLSNVRNASQYWKTLKQFRPRSIDKSKCIQLSDWNNFLISSFPDSLNSPSTQFYDVERNGLDSDFAIKELETEIKRLKCGKSPGPDGILNEHIKNFGNEARDKLLSLFNHIFNGGDIPTEFALSNLFMLHKKGDVRNPENFRSIALLNSTFKLLTSMMAKRILSWCEDNKIFCESQTGFRPGRGCVDNIFTLSSIINIRLMKGEKLYTAVIDFKSAFFEVEHDLMWEKLFAMGITAKFIRTLKNLYSQARTRIKVGDSLFTPFVSVSKGVLQGDSASAVLFILFLNDLEEYLIQHGSRGVNINHLHDIVSLLYCDDLILFANDKADLQRKLNLLDKYCELNKMIVNVSKTKIMIFRRGGRIRNSDVFYYKQHKLEVTGRYTYLGINFSSHAVFHQAAEYAKSKGRAAIANVKRIMGKSQMKSWESRIKLYEACVNSTLLYAAEVWAYRYADNVEKCQSFFFKSLYCLPRNTPNYMIRLEMGAVKLFYQIFNRMLCWWIKLLSMTQERYPKLCYTELCAWDLRSANVVKYNWVSQLKGQLVELGFAHVWESQDATLVKNSMDDILAELRSRLIQSDIERVRNSSYSNLYRELKPLDNILAEESFVSPYLLKNLHIDGCRVIAQIRLCSDIEVRIFSKGIPYSWNSEEECPLCNLREKEDLNHFIFNCPHYNILRLKLPSAENRSLVEILNKCELSELKSLYYFVIGSLRRRSFLLDE